VEPSELERLRADNERLRSELAALHARIGPFPPGHFHSPIPDFDEVQRDEANIFRDGDRELPGIDRREAQQWQRLRELLPYAKDAAFPRHATAGRRYYWDNAVFQYADAFVLYAMLRHFRPRRWIEIGSGFSSAVFLDTQERHPEIATQATFIDPDSTRIDALLSPRDLLHCEVVRHRVQDLPLERFLELDSGDVLFIDSSHVSKLGSDVNYLFFEVLPRLRRGVFLHVHDIPAAFEYPRQWVAQRWAWNEAYLLRALLQHSSAFVIELHPAYLAERDPAACMRALPEAPGIGTSIWLRRV
jgi:hypothetical protein